MKRLISMLAAGVLAAGTLFATAGVASAGAAAAHRQGCMATGFSAHLNHPVGTTTFFLGTPVNTFSGAVVRLKPSPNNTTNWSFCADPTFPGNQFVITNPRASSNLALTSRQGIGGLVTVETTGNFGFGFASQRWQVTGGTAPGTLNLQNVKTGLSLRVRNSCCFFGQTVTTGVMATDWVDTF
jgi:hypothetical protein